jgi:PilX N-terminal
MQTIKYLPNNEKGSVLVAAIMILALLTIIGISATSTSTTEQHLAVNTLLYERAFYAAEAGFEHAKGVLKVPYTEQNQSNIALGNPGRWTFVLNGSGVIAGLPAAQDCAPLDGSGNCSGGDGVGDFEGGVVLLQSDLDGISYTVTVWNNDDRSSGGTPTDDEDGKIMIRSVATGPRGSICAIESLIEGTTDSAGMDGYKAQAGAGAGKSYRNNDLETITDFTKQM